jgi:hypothetical protein
MTDYACPINNRACRCDPNAANKKFRPCVLAKRIASLVRLMSSNIPGEADGAAGGLKRLLQSEGLFNDLAVLIENANGAIEELKYSDTEVEVIYQKGVEKGRVEGAKTQTAPPEFFDEFGEPRWLEIAMFCQQNSARLRSQWEQGFANDIPGSVAKYGHPTERQIPHLLAIFVKLGGCCDPEIIKKYRRT